MKGGFGGAKTPEQRSSVVTSGEIKQKAHDGEKGGMPMKAKNNTVAPQLIKINWRHLFLVGLHLFVFFCSALSQPLVTMEVAARALPQALL